MLLVGVELHGSVNTIMVMSSRSIYPGTLSPGRLSPVTS